MIPYEHLIFVLTEERLHKCMRFHQNKGRCVALKPFSFYTYSPLSMIWPKDSNYIFLLVRGSYILLAWMCRVQGELTEFIDMGKWSDNILESKTNNPSILFSRSVNS